MQKAVFEQRIEEIWEKMSDDHVDLNDLDRIENGIRLLELEQKHRSTGSVDQERIEIAAMVREIKATAGLGPRQQLWLKNTCNEILSGIAARAGTQEEIPNE